MTWMYTILAEPAPRLLMRVALIFDQQLLTLSDLSWRSNDGEGNVAITLCVRCEESLARRMHAKLLHLQDILQAELVTAEEGTSGPSLTATTSDHEGFLWFEADLPGALQHQRCTFRCQLLNQWVAHPSESTVG